jgi:hypothetical protein
MSQYLDNKDMFLEPSIKQYGSHMVMTNVQKPTKVKYYNLDTQFRDDYDEYSKTSPTFYNITIPQRINDVKSISVSNIEIPLSFYNISASLGNNIIQILNDSVSKTIIIPDNQYNLSGLENAINHELIQTDLSNISFNIQGNKSSFSIINPGQSYTIQFAVKSDMTTSNTSIRTEFDKFNIKSKLGWLLGFRNIQYTLSSVIQSESLVNINGPRYLYLVLDDFSQGNPYSFNAPISTSFLNNHILAKISIDPFFNTGFNTVYVANHSNGLLLSDKRVYTGKVDLQRMKIQIVNELGFPMNLNGLDFSFSLEIHYE